MFKAIIVVFESASCVVWRINVDALNFALKLTFQSLKCEQIVTKDKPVIEQIARGHSMMRVIGPLRIFQ
jgi:hypothetical protein